MPEMDRFQFELCFQSQGRCRIAGVDEAGRGPLAGPVFAAAVVFPERWVREGLPAELRAINDSKQLTHARRDELFEALVARPEVQYGIASVDAAVIDQINILQATHRAMNLALARLNPAPDFVLIDGRPVPSVRIPNKAIVKGDALSYSIAAASILAKVSRDRLMLELDRQYPGYGFAEHKGYGTPVHLAAIRKLGPCPIHRMTFAPIRPEEPRLL
jgi:ribonuclease HII